MNEQGPGTPKQQPDYTRIRANVQKMAAQGASAAEIEDYLASYEKLKPVASADFSGVQAGSSTSATPDPLSGDNVTNAFGEKVATAVNRGFQGLTLGYGDEIAGALDPFHTIQDYRDRGKILSQRNPGTGTAAEIAGGLAPIIATGGIGAAKAAPTLLRATGRAALEGAALGGIAGYGAAEGSQADQLTSAAGSAALGGVIGAAAPSLVRGAGAAYRTLTESGAAKASRIGTEQAIAALQRDGYSPDAARSIVVELQGAGAGNKPASLLDLPRGDNVRGAARGVASQPGPGRATLHEFTDARKAGQAARIQRDFSATSGTAPGSPSTEREAILRQRRLDDAENYGRSVDAMGDTPIDDPAINTLIAEKPSLEQAARAARASETERLGKSAMAAREQPAIAAPSAAPPTLQPPATQATRPTTGKTVDGLWENARTANGTPRPPHTVSDLGLFREYAELLEKKSDGVRRSTYRTAEDDDYSVTRQVATRHGKGPSEQAKAFQNLRDWQARMDKIEAELRTRGHDDDSIAERMLSVSDPEAAAERAAIGTEGAGSRTDFDFGANTEPVASAAPSAPGQGHTARSLQRMKQELDRKIQTLKNPNAQPGEHSDARAVAETRGQFVDRLNEVIPGYQDANRSSAQALGRADAVKVGAQMYGKHPDVVGEAFRALRSDAEREAFRRAYGQRYLTAIGGGRGGSDRAGSVFGASATLPGSETKLAQARHAFANDASFEQFLGGLGAEGKMAAGNGVVTGSPTAPTLSFQQDLAKHPAVKFAKSVGNMQFGDALGQLLMRSAESRAARLSEGSRGELAKILTADPQTLAQYLEAASKRSGATTRGGNALARALGAYTGLATSR